MAPPASATGVGYSARKRALRSTPPNTSPVAIRLTAVAGTRPQGRVVERVADPQRSDPEEHHGAQCRQVIAAARCDPERQRRQPERPPSVDPGGVVVEWVVPAYRPPGDRVHGERQRRPDGQRVTEQRAGPDIRLDTGEYGRADHSQSNTQPL